MHQILEACRKFQKQKQKSCEGQSTMFNIGRLLKARHIEQPVFIELLPETTVTSDTTTFSLLANLS